MTFLNTKSETYQQPIEDPWERKIVEKNCGCSRANHVKNIENHRESIKQVSKSEHFKQISAKSENLKRNMISEIQNPKFQNRKNIKIVLVHKYVNYVFEH